MTQNEINKVLRNPMTKQLVEFVDTSRKFSKKLISPQFFHKSHSERDRQIICKLLVNFYDNKITIERVGKDSVNIDFH
jgi:acid stress-induced BolA-like protein IbaG/YrbA